MLNKMQIAIDGPAGAGKSTVAKAVAELLGLFYLDTGAMYRAVAHKALINKVDIHSAEEVSRLAAQTRISFDHAQGDRVWCDGKDVTGAIRTPEVTRAVSVIAAYPEVRERLVAWQRLEAERGGVVMDGRDIGTQVLPRAELKVFLTASPEARAKRRWLEVQATGKEIALAEIAADMERRDRQDRERESSPLKPAADAVVLDTTGLTVEQVISEIVTMAQEGTR